MFSTGGLQLYLGDRGALRKILAPADLAGLQLRSVAPRWTLWLIPTQFTLPASAGDTLTIYGTHRRLIRYDPSSPDLSPVLQRLIRDVLGLAGRF